MAGKLQWVLAHLDEHSVLTCGHTVAGIEPLGGEVFCETCALHVVAQLDQDIAAAEEAARQRQEATE